LKSSRQERKDLSPGPMQAAKENIFAVWPFSERHLLSTTTTRQKNFEQQSHNENFPMSMAQGGGRTMTSTGGALHPLHFEIEVPSSNHDEANNNLDWEHLLDENDDDFESFDAKSVESFLLGIMEHDSDEFEVRQPPPTTFQDARSVDDHHLMMMNMVSPSPLLRTTSIISSTICSATTPEGVELELEFKRSMKKLASSMRRSDESRSMVKRQRSYNSSTGSSSRDFFQSQRCEELEHNRQTMFGMIQKNGM